MTNETNVEQWVSIPVENFSPQNAMIYPVLVGGKIPVIAQYLPGGKWRSVSFSGTEIPKGVTHVLTRTALSRQGDETAQGEVVVPQELIAYLIDAWKQIHFVGKPIKFPKYGGSVFVVFDNRQTYRLNLSLYNSEVTLDTSRTAEQKGEGEQKTLEELAYQKRAGNYMASRILELEAENKRLREGWVSVEDRVPEESGRYSIHIKNYNSRFSVDVGEYDASTKLFYYKGFVAYNTHWRELPPPPAQTDNDKKEMV
jgi:hypothetical protein